MATRTFHAEKRDPGDPGDAGDAGDAGDSDPVGELVRENSCSSDG